VKRALAFLHRWVGLVAGLYLGMLGLSGALLVLAPLLWSVERGVPAMPAERGDAAYVSPDIWVEKAKARYGDLPAIESFNAPLSTPMRIGAPTMTYSAMHYGEYATGVVVVDPYSGEPISNFVAQDSWSLWPLTLHMGFFLPFTIMWTVLVVLAWLVLGMTGSGLIAWWATRRRMRESFTLAFPKSPTHTRRLHAAIGAWASLPLVALAASGLLMSDKPLAQSVAATLGRHASESPAAACQELSTTPGQALDQARAHLPGYELGTMEAATDAEGVYAITLRPRGSTLPVRGFTTVRVSACGEIRSLTRPEDVRTGDLLLAGVVDVHSGRLAGWPGEWLVLATGLALILLPALGLWAWIWRVTRRRRGAGLASDPVAKRHPAEGGSQ